MDTDQDLAGSAQVRIWSPSGAALTGSPFPLTLVSGTPAAGAIYGAQIALTAPGTYTYRFAARDGVTWAYCPTGATLRKALPVTGAPAPLTNLFFLHHSTGANLVEQGEVRERIAEYNTLHHTSYAFWDHGYNGDGLRNPAGLFTGTNYNIPDDNTDPDGLYRLWCGADADAVACRNKILQNHQLIAFKSCFPASAISDDTMLQQYKSWYLAMRSFFDTRPDKLFAVMSAPPLHRLDTGAACARRARNFANWLSSSTYVSGHANVVCFNLFDYLAKADDGSATANMLRYQYEGSHTDSDSHPNLLANQTVGPIFADFLCNAAGAYAPPTS